MDTFKYIYFVVLASNLPTRAIIYKANQIVVFSDGRDRVVGDLRIEGAMSDVDFVISNFTDALAVL